MSDIKTESDEQEEPMKIVTPVKSDSSSFEEFRERYKKLLAIYDSSYISQAFDSLLTMSASVYPKSKINLAKWAYGRDLTSLMRKIQFFYERIMAEYKGVPQFEEYLKDSTLLDELRKYLMDIEPLDVAIYYFNEYDLRNPGEYWEPNNRPKCYGMIIQFIG